MAMNKPYAYAVIQGDDDRENVSLQFDHPEMCGQTYRQAIPLFTHPVKVNYEFNSSEQNKPVVYWDGKHFASKDKSSLADIPLYTHQYERPHNTVLVPCDKLAEIQAELALLKAHPVKELTDEEIEECWKQTVKQEFISKVYRFDFAKAILRKAQEQ